MSSLLPHQQRVVDELAVEESVELFGVDAM